MNLPNKFARFLNKLELMAKYEESLEKEILSDIIPRISKYLPKNIKIASADMTVYHPRLVQIHLYNKKHEEHYEDFKEVNKLPIFRELSKEYGFNFCGFPTPPDD